MRGSTSRQKMILLATCSYDEELLQPIVISLLARGYHVITYEADKVASGEKSMTIHINGESLTITYDGKPLDLMHVDAAWYRRPNVFSPLLDDVAKQYCLDRERKRLQEILWRTIPQKAWLNAPDRMLPANNKLAQLILAHRIGFNTPETIVSNQWSDIVTLPSEQVILKMPKGHLADKNGRKGLSTSVFDNTGEALVGGNPYPGIWQPFVPKSREWRVTIVGKNLFAAAIYTSDTAKDDWRRHQGTSNVEFREENFPHDTQQKCFKMLDHLGLRYGAFDFIESPGGQLTFLEVNTNGQYGWIERQLGLPISSAIADELAMIAETA